MPWHDHRRGAHFGDGPFPVCSGQPLGLYAALGASDLALQIESGVRDLAVQAPLVLVLVVGVPVAGLVVAAARTLRRPDDPTAEPVD